MAGSAAQILNGQRFLIAEDEGLIAMLLEDAVERCGGTVVATASSCYDVVAALGTHALDAIILDIHLQGGTSEDVVAIASEKNIPVLVCTGSDPTALSPIFRSLPVLKKPWRDADVQLALAHLVAAGD